MARATKRRWTKEERARCSCSGDPLFGGVVSAPRGPGDPYVQLDGADEPHLCTTAVWVSQRVPGPGRNPLRSTAVELASLSPTARAWYLALPTSARQPAVASALEVAAHQAAQLAAARDADHDARWCEVCSAYRGEPIDGCLCAPR